MATARVEEEPNPDCLGAIGKGGDLQRQRLPLIKVFNQTIVDRFMQIENAVIG
jgi:hypothetical protein